MTGAAAALAQGTMLADEIYGRVLNRLKGNEKRMITLKRGQKYLQR